MKTSRSTKNTYPDFNSSTGNAKFHEGSFVMKRFSKILSIGLSAVMLISGSSVLAGAATYKNVVYCSGTDCKNVQCIIEQIKNGNCCDWSSLHGI